MTETPSAPDAVAAVAQSRGGEQSPVADDPLPREAGEAELYRISDRVAAAEHTALHEPSQADPLYRPLKIFALDPGISRLDGAIASTRVQYERLEPGPVGSVVEVSNVDAAGEALAIADLDDRFVLMDSGYTPSLSRPEFHQQMVYAVAMMTYDAFKVALGRNVAWAFPRRPGQERTRLLLRPHGAEEANAWYDRHAGEIVFGYFRARGATSVAQKDQGYVFTAMSHDIIAHEMSHALLDGLRSHFMIPTHQDVLAFHEAFADLVACFQHFTFPDAVAAAMKRARGDLAGAAVLVELAQDFGRGLGEDRGPLRTLVDLHRELPRDDEPAKQARPAAHGPERRPEAEFLTYEKSGKAPHELGGVLSRAVFSAFMTVYKRRTRKYFRLASAGTGEIAAGDLPPDLLSIIVGEVQRLAGQFLSICIRAVDYCPPVDVRFGDYLQAIITADRDLVRDDDLAYREAIIQAFGDRGIYGEGTLSMTEDALCWHGPNFGIDAVKDLSFGEMKFDGDPARPAGAREMRRQAGALGRLASEPRVAREFGIVSPHSPEFADGGFDLPIVELIRPARRVGPDRSVSFDTVAEIVQRRYLKDRHGRTITFYGGATVILGPRGDIRYIIRKRIDNERRLEQQQAFMDGEQGLRLWEESDGRRRPSRHLAKRMCVHSHDE